MTAENGRVPCPREWVGEAAFPWPAVDELAGGASVVACYSVATCQKDQTKAGKPYYKLQLTDRNGLVEARVWDPVADVMALVRQGVFVGVRGTVELFNGARQVKVNEILPIAVPPEDLELFMPRSGRDPAEMDAELAGLVESVCDPGLRALLLRLLGPESETGRLFRRAPAAKQNHHACVGGLLEHTLSMAGACALMAQHYGARIDRDLLLTGALLHDVGKIREIGTQAGFPYTDEGKLLGHILIGLQLVSDAAREIPELAQERLLLVQHLVAAHQGRYEWQSPREPRILEALVLHYCDDLDAKMAQVSALLRTLPEGASGWTAHDRGLGRDFFAHTGDAGARTDAENGLESVGLEPPEAEELAAPRRHVRFAGRVAHEGKGKADGRAPGEGQGAPAPQPERSAPEALPLRPVSPPEDVLPPDPHSLDLFE